ncbi:hypothetical protein KKB69_02345 [Patescibacteria group bacterium]|nr:hypothetical protein [Patescibacteria group bacterium]
MNKKIKDFLGAVIIFSLLVFVVVSIVCVKAYYNSIATAKGLGGEVSATSAIEPGSQEITSNITLVYEIK